MKKIYLAVIIVLLFAAPVMADSTHIGGTDYNQSTDIGNVGSLSPAARTFSPEANATAIQGQNQGQQQGQAQQQGQLQGQGQGQGQAQKTNIDLNNGQSIAPVQEITIINPENKRDLPLIPMHNAPAGMEYRGPYEKGVAGKVKVWTLKDSWTEDEIAGLYSRTDSAECKVFPITKKEKASETATLKVGKGTGAIIAIMECKAESDIELWGTAATKAQAAGGLFVEEVAYAVTYSNKSAGWNIGFGGGVTAVNGGNDNYGGAVGGGTGFGSVETRPVAKIAAIFMVR
jgi:hypothetical protein